MMSQADQSSYKRSIFFIKTIVSSLENLKHCIMWSLIYACILFLLQHSCVAPFTVELIPEVDQCANVKCPQLSCPSTVLRQGSCCRSCITTETFCLKDGIPYAEESIVPSDSVDAYACKVCHCCEGKTVCGNVSESCPRLKCDKSQQVKDEGKCCARCDNAPSTQSQAICTENGIIYQEGDVWNPYFSKFGVVKCQICTCKNGTTSCETVPCPPVRACTPDDSVEEITACCPKCNRNLSEQQNSNSTSTYSAPTLFPEKPTESSVTCPLVYSYKVYKTIDTKVDQIAIEHINFSYVDVYVWSPAHKSVKYKSYSSKSFAEKHLNTRFKYIGDSTAESVKTVGDWFMVQKKKLSLYYCKRNCSPRVIKLLQPCK